MQIEEMLLTQYGPLLSMAQLASLLDRSSEGSRISLRSDGEWARSMNTAKIKIGRRVYFRTVEVAKILSGI